MECRHKMKLHYDGVCTIIVEEKKNKTSPELYGHFLVSKCAHCKYLKGKLKDADEKGGATLLARTMQSKWL